MRQTAMVLAMLAAAGCAAPDTGRYDPNVYDADGNIAPPPAPAPALAPTSAGPSASQTPECREAQRSVFIGGEPRAATATACRQPDGSWRFTE